MDHGLSKNCTNYKSSAAMGGIVFEIDPERHDEEMEKLLSNGVTLGEHRWGFAVALLSSQRTLCGASSSLLLDRARAQSKRR